jgi:hypothetical protein
VALLMSLAIWDAVVCGLSRLTKMPGQIFPADGLLLLPVVLIALTDEIREVPMIRLECPES